MDRRRFLKFLGIGGVSLAAAEAIPFGRVWSFPSKIVIPEADMAWDKILDGTELAHLSTAHNLADLATVYYDRKAIEIYA